MKKILYIFLCSLILSVAAWAQAKSADAIRAQAASLGLGKAISVEFDAAAGTTTIRAVAENFNDADARRAGIRAINFAAGVIAPGDGLKSSAGEFLFSFWIMSRAPRFESATAAEFIVGTETLPAANFRYSARRREDMEYVNVTLRRVELEKIASAASVRAKIGNSEFTFTPRQLQLLRGLLAITEVRRPS